MGEALKQRIQQEVFSDPAQEAVVNLLVAADFIRTRMGYVCAKHDLTIGQFNVLRILKGVYPEGHARCEITKRMIERAPDITRLVDRLEQRELVERIGSGVDRRLSITRITPPGLALVKVINPQIEGLLRVIRRRISVEDCRRLSRICEELYF